GAGAVHNLPGTTLRKRQPGGHVSQLLQDEVSSGSVVQKEVMLSVGRCHSRLLFALRCARLGYHPMEEFGKGTESFKLELVFPAEAVVIDIAFSEASSALSLFRSLSPPFSCFTLFFFR
ncbi:unnamed protein product, partial [Phaeothamnion confervicola]